MKYNVHILVLRMAESGFMHISNPSRVSGMFVYTDGRNLHDAIAPIQIYMYHILPGKLSRALVAQAFKIGSGRLHEEGAERFNYPCAHPRSASW